MTISLILVSVGNQAFAQSAEIIQTQILDPIVILETNLGNITIEFFNNDAPNHVENFIKLSVSGFYDGTIFHRIIPGFMIQGGDPNTIDGDPSTWGQGGPTERVDAEFNTIKHNRGIVSMARSADPNSAGSQFFIVHKDSNFLDEQYTVFGRIVTDESFETLDKIAAVEIGSSDRPIDTEQVKITKVTTVPRSEASNLLELPDPERTQSIEPQQDCIDKADELLSTITFSTTSKYNIDTIDNAKNNYIDCMNALGIEWGFQQGIYGLSEDEWQVIFDSDDKCVFSAIKEDSSDTLEEVADIGKHCDVSYAQMIRDAIQNNHIITKETPPTGNQKFESTELEITFSAPEGWLLQKPDKTQQNSPDVLAVGPKIGAINPVISLTVQQTNQRTLDDLISEKADELIEVIESENLKIISQEKTTINGYQAYVTDAEGFFLSDNEKIDIKFKEVLIYDTEKSYTLAYANGIYEFDSQLPRFDETIDSFEILSKDSSENELNEEGGGGGTVISFAGDELIAKNELNEEGGGGGGCLIATATYGSELSPQVQQLRELRDNKLLNTESGVSFMNTFNDLYYSFSPYIADYERENPVFKEIVKLGITPMISSLSILNYVDMDSETKVLGYGISLIILNFGMYIGIPASVIIGIRRYI